MGLYTRRQLVLLLALLAAAGIGLAVRHWRAAHPDAAMRLEGFDLGMREGRRERGAGGGRPGERPASWRPKPAGPIAGEPIDLNQATADDLTRLPGIGPALAARIVAARAAAVFSSVDDLERVRGLGRGRIERLRPHLSVDTPVTGSSPGARARRSIDPQLGASAESIADAPAETE